MIRHTSIAVLLLASVAVPPSTPGRPAVGPRATVAPTVPEAVLAARDEGRYWRASRLMADYLATQTDTSRTDILFAARLHAGWGDWDGVARLLEGRDWLDAEEQGAGLDLLGRSRIARGEPGPGADALARFLDVSGADETERGTTELRRGLALEEAERVPEALESLARARRLLPWLADWAIL
ncbi:MAG: hypothetical protein P8177_08230 [Gemmatimonadota bacterium]